MQASDIRQMIETGLQGSQVEVTGDGTHFDAVVVHAGFAGKPMLEQHRMVYATLGDKMETEAIHALSIRTFTPEQWEARQEQSS